MHEFLPRPASASLPSLSALLDDYTDPAILLDTRYRILAENRAYRACYGGTRAQGLRHCYQVSHHNDVPCDLAGECCPLKESLASGTPCRVLHVHHTPRGEEHVEVETRPIRNAQGKIAWFIEIMRPSRIAASVHPGSPGMIGRSGAFNAMLELVRRVAHSSTAVLLLGESGTGKELVAQAIHAASARNNHPFVPVECSGLSETLFESELFGHERGAFTGATHRTAGLVESARGGTLFLDEIGDIPAAMQVKLLRLIETGTYRRVGDTRQQHADFRLICATHHDLHSQVQADVFRRDLYYRINAFPITLPPLRERREDLPLLSSALLQRLAPQPSSIRLSPEALECLQHYDFPGNIRELRNILERGLLLADGNEILPEHLPPYCRMPAPDILDKSADSADTPPQIRPLHEVERDYLRHVVKRFNGNRHLLAQQLGLSERTLYRKLQALETATKC